MLPSMLLIEKGNVLCCYSQDKLWKEKYAREFLWKEKHHKFWM